MFALAGFLVCGVCFVFGMGQTVPDHISSPPPRSLLCRSSFAQFVILGDYKLGKQLCDLSLRVLDRAESQRTRSSTSHLVFGYVFHWQEPVQRQQDRLLEGYRDGMAVGDVMNAFYCLSHLLYNAFWMGTALSSFYADVVGHCDQAERYSQDLVADLFYVSTLL